MMVMRLSPVASGTAMPGRSGVMAAPLTVTGMPATLGAGATVTASTAAAAAAV